MKNPNANRHESVGYRICQSRSLRGELLLFPDDWRFEGEETTADRVLRLLIDDVAGGLDIVPVVEDLALTGFDLTGLVGSRRLLPIFEFPLLLMTIPWLPA